MTILYIACPFLSLPGISNLITANSHALMTASVGLMQPESSSVEQDKLEVDRSTAAIDDDDESDRLMINDDEEEELLLNEDDVDQAGPIEVTEEMEAELLGTGTPPNNDDVDMLNVESLFASASTSTSSRNTVTGCGLELQFYDEPDDIEEDYNNSDGGDGCNETEIPSSLSSPGNDVPENENEEDLVIENFMEMDEMSQCSQMSIASTSSSVQIRKLLADVLSNVEGEEVNDEIRELLSEQVEIGIGQIEQTVEEEDEPLDQKPVIEDLIPKTSTATTSTKTRLSEDDDDDDCVWVFGENGDDLEVVTNDEGTSKVVSTSTSSSCDGCVVRASKRKRRFGLHEAELKRFIALRLDSYCTNKRCLEERKQQRAMLASKDETINILKKHVERLQTDASKEVMKLQKEVNYMVSRHKVQEKIFSAWMKRCKQKLSDDVPVNGNNVPASSSGNSQGRKRMSTGGAPPPSTPRDPNNVVYYLEKIKVKPSAPRVIQASLPPPPHRQLAQYQSAQQGQPGPLYNRTTENVVLNRSNNVTLENLNNLRRLTGGMMESSSPSSSTSSSPSTSKGIVMGGTVIMGSRGSQVPVEARAVGRQNGIAPVAINDMRPQQHKQKQPVQSSAANGCYSGVAVKRSRGNRYLDSSMSLVQPVQRYNIPPPLPVTQMPNSYLYKYLVETSNRMHIVIPPEFVKDLGQTIASRTRQHPIARPSMWMGRPIPFDTPGCNGMAPKFTPTSAADNICLSKKLHGHITYRAPPNPEECALSLFYYMKLAVEQQPTQAKGWELGVVTVPAASGKTRVTFDFGIDCLFPPNQALYVCIFLHTPTTSYCSIEPYRFNFNSLFLGRSLASIPSSSSSGDEVVVREIPAARDGGGGMTSSSFNVHERNVYIPRSSRFYPGDLGSY